MRNRCSKQQQQYLVYVKSKAGCMRNRGTQTGFAFYVDQVLLLLLGAPFAAIQERIYVALCCTAAYPVEILYVPF